MMENSKMTSQKIKIDLPYNVAIPLPKYKVDFQRDIFMLIFVLFTIAKSNPNVH